MPAAPNRATIGRSSLPVKGSCVELGDVAAAPVVAPVVAPAVAVVPATVEVPADVAAVVVLRLTCSPSTCGAAAPAADDVPPAPVTATVPPLLAVCAPALPVATVWPD